MSGLLVKSLVIASSNFVELRNPSFINLGSSKVGMVITVVASAFKERSITRRTRLSQCLFCRGACSEMNNHLAAFYSQLSQTWCFITLLF